MSITTAVITGDIINSRKDSPEAWLTNLKKVLNTHGKEPKQWEIYRGDSFQLEISPEKALKTAIHIKASLKQKKGIDVRMSIGLGGKDYHAEKVTESNGSAFVFSGECFENLKKQTLAIKSGNEAFDTQINLMLQLASLTMDAWLPATSRVVKTALEHPKSNQKELAALLEKSQSNISEALIRAGFDEVQKMIQFYTTQLIQL
ncbi:transcriptional regulator [Flagellimonas onchidii]|uniref:transcriptional regulator n=1 Tax=Flagellimonas onchidii TaxID=2562684 RepID=UPI0010A608C2|nr:transcriptional regulator [Allomuricauda onchidii]